MFGREFAHTRRGGPCHLVGISEGGSKLSSSRLGIPGLTTIAQSKKGLLCFRVERVEPDHQFIPRAGLGITAEGGARGRQLAQEAGIVTRPGVAARCVRVVS